MPQHLTVQGRGIISATPDQIVIGFELSHMHKDYGKCVSSLNERLEQFYQAVEKAGIESNQIKLSNYNIDAKYDYLGEHHNKRVFSGYIASYHLRLELDLEPKTINHVLSMVANNTRDIEINLNFEVKDIEPFRNQALENAIASAKTKAELITKATGVTLGKIANINYGSIIVEFEQPRMSMKSSDAFLSESREMTPEDVKMSDDVTITWEIS